MDILKIATFNINGIRSRLPALLEWLEREGPDVVCLRATTWEGIKIRSEGRALAEK